MLTAEKQRGFVPDALTPNFKDGVPFFPVIAQRNILNQVLIGKNYQMFVLPEDHDKFNPLKLKVDIHDLDFKFIMGLNFYDFDEFQTCFLFSHE